MEGAAKITKGLEVGDGALGINQNVDVKVTPSLVAGIRSTKGGNEPTAISTSIDASGNNKLMVDTSTTGNSLFYGSLTADIHIGNLTLATVPAGKTWRILFVYKGATANATYIFFTIPAAYSKGPSQNIICMASSTAFQFTSFPPYGMRLPPGSIIIFAQGAAGDTSQMCGYAYIEEPAGDFK